MPPITPLKQKCLSGVLSFLHTTPFFLGTLLLHYQLGQHFSLLLIPAGPAGTQAQIQSYAKWSWVLLGVAALLLLLTLFLGKARYWAVWPLVGCVVGAVVSRFLTPFYF